MATYAIVIEIELPDGVPFDTAWAPVVDAIRATVPYPPKNVTAHTGRGARDVLYMAGHTPTE